MSQSLVKNYVHIVFSTMYREPLIYAPHEEELFAYLGGICKKNGVPSCKSWGIYWTCSHIVYAVEKNRFNEIAGGDEVAFFFLDEAEGRLS